MSTPRCLFQYGKKGSWYRCSEETQCGQKLIERYNFNPIPNTRQYEVRFSNGGVNELTANVISEAMYAQCDEDGNEYVLFAYFVDKKGRKGFFTEG